MSIIIPANSAVGGGFEVANSARFNRGSSDSLTRTLGTPTNNKKWTYSFWVKQSLIDVDQYLLNTGSDTSYIYFRPSNANPAPFGFSIEQYVGGFQYRIIPNMVFRDPSAWRHIVIAFDTTQGTDTNRVKVYDNGTQITSFNTASYPSQNLDTQTNSALAHKIGGYSSGGYLGGYLSEVCFIDGQQLAADSFGEFDEDSGVWKPIESVADLTFGNNGFYLDFEDSSALGNDAAGSNNFTVNNLTAVDQSTDTCTNNFATMNPLENFYSNFTFSEGNLSVVSGANGYFSPILSTIGIPATSGKWYCEVKFDVASTTVYSFIGITGSPITQTNLNIGGRTYGYAYIYNGQKYNNNSGSSYGNGYVEGDIIGIAVDATNSKIYFSKNGTWQNSGNPESGSTGTGAAFTISTTPTQGFYFFGCSDDNNGTGTSAWSWNFGNPPYAISSGNADGNGRGNFEYAVPSGYLSLCTKNLSKALS